MSGCTPTPEAKKIIRAMAQELVHAGHTDADAIVDRIHETIHEHTPLYKSEIADIISGYGQKPQPTKDMLRMRMNALRAQLREASRKRDIAAGKIPGPRSPEEVRNQARQKQITKEIDELKDRMARGDFAPKQDKERVAYTAETNSLISQRNHLRKQIDRMAARAEYAQSGRATKIASTFLAWRRAILLSSVRTIEKLSLASAYRVGLQPIEHAAQGALGLVPGIHAIAKRAPLEGRFSPRAEAMAARAVFSRKMLAEMKDKLLHGENERDLLWGNGSHGILHPWLSLVSNVHAALHNPAERNEFTRAQQMQTEFEVRHAIESGMTPEQAAAHMADPMTQAKIDMRAYEASQRAIFFNKNFIVSAFHALQGVLRNAGTEGSAERTFGKSAANTMEFMFPIVRVPSNFAGEVASYSLGAAKAAVQMIAAKGAKNLTPDQADYIMRNLGKQSLGAIVAAIGWYGYKQVGSFYQTGDNKRKAIPEADSAWGLPKWAIDTPIGTMLTIGATMHRISDGIKKRNGENVKGTGTVAEGVRASTVGVLENVPFFDEFGHLTDAFQSTGSMATGAGSTAASLVVPPDVRRIAAAQDNYTPRKPQNFTQALEMTIPGLRQNVPGKRPR